MKTATATIDRESAAALKALLNQNIMLFAPHADMDYGSSVIAAKHVSIALTGGDRFVTGKEDAVRFDAGIRITRQDGTLIAIVRRQSIAGLLEFAALPEDNDCLASDLQTRLLYGALP